MCLCFASATLYTGIVFALVTTTYWTVKACVMFVRHSQCLNMSDHWLGLIVRVGFMITRLYDKEKSYL